MVDLNLSLLQLQDLFEYGDHRYIVLYKIHLDKFELISHIQIYTNMNNGI